MKRFLILFFAGIITGFCYQASAQSLFRIVLTGDNHEVTADTESNALFTFLKSIKGVEVEYIPLDALAKQLKSPGKFNLTWYHRVDSSAFPKVINDKKFKEALLKYLDEGGNLVLTMDAFQLLPVLGLESTIPEVRQKPCIDEGYGRKLGFHAFREHPLFNGLNGGSYVYTPATDMTVRVNGYFDSIVPQGMVAGIDWDYIFFRENSKLVLEYNAGKGKVIAIGEYLYFSRENRNRLQLERFSTNIVDYFKGGESHEKYWYYGPYDIVECPEKPQLDQFFQPIPESRQWPVPGDPIAFPPVPASGNPWDLAGERILIMGSQQSGIEEIWTHPFMALRDYEAGVIFQSGDSVSWLKSFVPEIVINTFSISRKYSFQGGTLTETVVADPSNPTGVCHYQYSGEKKISLVIRFSSNLRIMWPYPAQSIGGLCYTWDVDYQAFRVGDKSGDFAVIAGANKQPSEHQINKSADAFQINASATYALQGGDLLDFVISGTSQGVATAFNDYDMGIRNPLKILEESAKHESDLLKRSLIITSPDDNFNKGFRWALAGTDKFMVNTPGMGTSLVAGYATTKHGWDGEQKVSGRPGYAWYFGRDGQWSGFALLDYGDYSKVRSILKFYEKYQDLSGKIFHEATTSGVIHYDAADATPLYIVLAGKYFRHTNDSAYLRESWPAISKALWFCQSTDTDGDMLIENTNVGHGWVEGGELYGSHSTLYLNSCWTAALEEAANMAMAMKDPTAESYTLQAREVRKIINKDFWLSSQRLGGPGMEFGYFSYGKNKDKTYRKEITVLPSVCLYLGIADPGKAGSMIGYWSGNNFSTNWGVRIIGDDSPLFKPTGYHYGSVWPLFTGWTALAEYKYGRSIQGFTHIMNNLNVYRNWALGYVEEVLNGAVYKPSGVCPHQCWSETMVLQPAIEGMLGFDAFAQENRVVLSPDLPVEWDSLRVDNLRIADKTFSMEFQRTDGKSVYTFTPAFQGELNVDFSPVFPAGTRITGATLNGEVARIATFSSDQSTTMVVKFNLDAKVTINITFEGGIRMIPLVYDPVPGVSAEGPRIISSRLKGNIFTVITEGQQGTNHEFRYWDQGAIHTFTAKFPASDEKYSLQTTEIDVTNQ